MSNDAFVKIVLTITTIFVALVGWLAVRIVDRLDDLTQLMQSDVKEVLHTHDVRLIKLEREVFKEKK